MTMSRGSVAVKSLNGELILPVSGVEQRVWERFVHAMTLDDDVGERRGQPRPFSARTSSGGLGCFGMSPQRLVDLGVLKDLYVAKGKAIANPNDKRVVAFLSHPLVQYGAFVASMKRYDLVISKLTLPDGMTRSGALALHHRLGPKALVKWAAHQEPSTVVLFRRTNGLF